MNLRMKAYSACFQSTLSSRLLSLSSQPGILLAPLVCYRIYFYNNSGMHYYLGFKHKGTEVKRRPECSLLMVELRFEFTSDPKDQILFFF